MNDGDIIKEGYLRRLKTQKKRYFVLRSSTPSGKARLEYYESERKFRSKGLPKRTIHLASCLNIAKKEDARNKCVFALYTREDVFGLIADSEDELNLWLNCLTTEQSKSETLREPVSTWHVTVKPRGLGTSKSLAGQFDLLLSSRNLTLVKTDTKETVSDFQLVNIRRCGHTDCFFFMELGRSAATGAGEMWMQVDDQVIAQNMHEAILGTMQNISVSDAAVPARRRCESEGKKVKSKTRPLSAVVISGNRDRSDTLPGSPQSRIRAGSSTSARGIAPDSPRSKRSSVLYWLLPRRKSKDVSSEFLAENLNSNNEGQGSDLTSDKVLISPSQNRISMLDREERQPEYVNVSPGGVQEPASVEDYMRMDAGDTGSIRQSSDSYIDMARDQQTQASAKKTLFSPEEGYIDMTSPGYERDSAREQSKKRSVNPKYQSSSARSDFVQQKRSSSPRQLKTSESALPNKPDIREFVNIKKSPAASRRRSSHDYVPMNPVVFSEDDTTHSYMNFSPGADSTSDSPSRDQANERDEPRLYVNFSPGELFNDANKLSIERNQTSTPRKLFQNELASASNEELPSYVNFSPGKSFEETTPTSSYRKHSLESILVETPREYMNVDFSGISKSKSAADMRERERVDFVLRSPVEHRAENSLANGSVASENDMREYVNFSPGKSPVAEAWRKSPRNNRRESEPARLQPPKYEVNSQLDSTQEVEEREELNYIMLDLKKTDSPSRQRQRPPNIDLSACNRSGPGPKSAPVRSAYTEVDFTKSHGLRQARLEMREAKT